jgi:hypothetical protein
MPVASAGRHATVAVGRRSNWRLCGIDGIAERDLDRMLIGEQIRSGVEGRIHAFASPAAATR